MDLTMTTRHDTTLKHGEPFLLVNSEHVVCVRLPIKESFDPELILAGAEGNTARISYAEDDEDVSMATIARTDGGGLAYVHGYHSTYLGHADLWLCDPSVLHDPDAA